MSKQVAFVWILFPLVILAVGLVALYRAPFLGIDFKAQENKWYIADADGPAEPLSTFVGAEVLSINSMALESDDLVQNFDMIATKQAFYRYITFQLHMAVHIQKNKAIELTLRLNEQTYVTSVIAGDYPLRRLFDREWSLFIAALFCLAIGFTVLLKKSYDTRVQLFAIMMANAAVIFISFAFWTSRSISVDLFSTLLLSISNTAAFVLFPVFFLHFFLLFPQRSRITEKKGFAIALYALALPVTLVYQTRISYEALQLLFASGIGGGVLVMLYNFFRSTDMHAKAQLKWILWGTGLFSAVMFVTQILPPMGYLDELYSYQAPAVAFGLIPLSIALAVLKYRLMEVDRFIDQTLIYALTFFILLVMDLLLLFLIGIFTSSALDLSNLYLFVAALWITLMAYQPVRSYAVGLIHRLLKRSRYNADAIALELAKSLLPLTQREKVIALGIDEITAALHPRLIRFLPSTASIDDENLLFLNSLDISRIHAPAYLYDLLPASELPEPYRAGAIVPMKGNGSPFGHLLISDKTSQQFYERRDLQLIEMVATQMAGGIEAIAMREEVRRKELHAKEDKERMIREIHDGIGGIATNISLLSEIAKQTHSTVELHRSIGTISELSKEAITEIRQILESLDISHTDWNELISEIRRYGQTMLEPLNIAFELHIKAAPLEEAPDAYTVLTIFRICREALTNIVKHAQATRVCVRLQLAEDAFDLSIEDNGIGMSASKRGGRGLQHMQKRSKELGGHVTVTSSGGTTLALHLPLHATEADTHRQEILE